MHLPPGIWVLIVVTVVIAGLAMFGYLTGAWEQAAAAVEGGTHDHQGRRIEDGAG